MSERIQKHFGALVVDNNNSGASGGAGRVCMEGKDAYLARDTWRALSNRLGSLLSCLEASAAASFGLMLSDGVSEPAIKAMMTKYASRK